MKSIVSSLKDTLRLIFPHFGLYKYTAQIKNISDPKRRPYRSIKRFKVTLNGVTVQFNTDDEYSNRWFFTRHGEGRIHEKITTEMLIETLQGAKCFVDVGTNLGWYTCLASKHMPDGAVYGFEMDDLNFALLKKNLAINNCSNVEAHNLAVSDSPGIVSYKRERYFPSPMFHLQTNIKNESSTGFVSAHSVALDDFLQGKGIVPGVIKIDVEGAEMSVLMGMEQTLKVCKPIFFLEIHPNNLHYFNTSTDAILSLLLENNYKVFEIESFRNQGTKKQLKRLLRDSIIENNTMLYATAAEGKDSNAVY